MTQTALILPVVRSCRVEARGSIVVMQIMDRGVETCRIEWQAGEADIVSHQLHNAVTAAMNAKPA